MIPPFIEAQHLINNHFLRMILRNLIMATWEVELRWSSMQDHICQPTRTARIPSILQHRHCFQVSSLEHTNQIGSMLTRPGDDQSFLHDPLNHIDSTFMSNSFQPYKDNTGRQWRHIFITSLSRWLITAGLCAAMIWVTIWWQKQPVVSEGSKKLYNTVTTGISIALGLNIASAFKDMALNMRWPILSARARNLVEVSRITFNGSQEAKHYSLTLY